MLANNWLDFLKQESSHNYFRELSENLAKHRSSTNVYPPPTHTFAVYSRTPLSDIKVVILGQDPYHNGEATGVAFEALSKVPASLKNIYKEIRQDLNGPEYESSDLKYLTDQGVFLLNRVLTVESGKPNSHCNIGWETLTQHTIEHISNYKENVVFMLWGKKAQDAESFIDSSKHLILKAAHPSPLSAKRGFFGCGHFSKCNNYLKQHNVEPISWIPKEILNVTIIERKEEDYGRSNPKQREIDFGY